MASANKKFTPLKKCACNLHEPQHIRKGAVRASTSYKPILILLFARTLSLASSSVLSIRSRINIG